MKKVKIILIAITVLAVAGGTLAFKATKLPLFKAYTCDVAASRCHLEFEPVIIGTQIARPLGTVTFANIEGWDCTNGVIDCTFPITIEPE